MMTITYACDPIVSLPTPDTATLHVGASVLVTAGEGWSSCDRRPRRQYGWQVSDSTVATVAAVDSMTAKVTGMSVGSATVQPFYLYGGNSLLDMRVTVIP